jgi:hypothetical protein
MQGNMQACGTALAENRELRSRVAAIEDEIAKAPA